MTAKPFFDTNVLIYAFGADDDRKNRATGLMASGGIVTVQVVNEFVNVARRKLRRDWASVLDALGQIRSLLDPPLPLTMDVHDEAILIAQRYGYRFYDSLVLSAAKLAGCRLLYTEDLRDGQNVEGVLIRNPFRHAEPGIKTP